MLLVALFGGAVFFGVKYREEASPWLARIREALDREPENVAGIPQPDPTRLVGQRRNQFSQSLSFGLMRGGETDTRPETLSPGSPAGDEQLGNGTPRRERITTGLREPLEIPPRRESLRQRRIRAIP